MLALLLLACAPTSPPPAGSGNSNSNSNSDDDGGLALSAPDTGATPWSTLRGRLQLEVGFREAAAGDRACTLVWTAEEAVPVDRCAACDFAFDLTWTLDEDASAPGEHCAPVEGPLPMALGLAPATPEPVWSGEPGAPLSPWTPATPLLQEEGGWTFAVGEADVLREDGRYDTDLWTGWLLVE